MFKGEVAQLEAWQAETTLTQESARSKARRGSWSAFEAQLAPAKPSSCGLHKHISKRGGSWLYKRVAQTLHSNNCVRGNGCPKSSTVGSQPHIAQTFRHRSSSSEDQLIFLLFLPCIDWTWYFGSHFSLKSYGICHVWLKHYNVIYICGEMYF